jgi:FKBP-type peptidyl-prolyl cis-trans isomerase SlyD
MQEIPKEEFDEIEDLEVGMEYEVETEEGPLVILITEIGDEVVTVDGNHPFSGMNLSFKVAVREIRKATEEELEHGHAHGPGDDPH